MKLRRLSLILHHLSAVELSFLSFGGPVYLEPGGGFVQFLSNGQLVRLEVVVGADNSRVLPGRLVHKHSPLVENTPLSSSGWMVGARTR